MNEIIQQNITLGVQLFLMVFTITRFEPLNLLFDTIEETYPKLNSFFIYNLGRLLLTCSKCLSFWLGWVVFGNLFLAMGLSFFFVLFEKTIGSWLDKQTF